MSRYLQPIFQRLMLGLALVTSLPLYAIDRADVALLEETLFVEGRAYDKRSGEWVYSETHYCNSDRDACRIVYSSPDGVPIVEKVLDYSVSSSAPDFKQFDLRNEQLLAAKLDGDSARFAQQRLPAAQWQGFATALSSFAGAVAASEQLVIDAGFDNYVRSRWDELSGGDKVRFDFALPSRASSLPMVARRKPAAVCNAAGEKLESSGVPATNGEQGLCLEIAPANWLISSFVSPIRLEYDVTNRQLQSFAGMSNIPDEQGRSHRVYIVYDYPGPDARLTGAWHGKDTGWHQ